LRQRASKQKLSIDTKTSEVNMIAKTQHRVGILGKLLLGLMLFGSFQISLAQDFVWAPDFPVGASIPEISAQDQDGNFQTFDDLKGEKGMLFMMSRSFDW
jgi:hypothetical protein